MFLQNTDFNIQTSVPFNALKIYISDSRKYDLIHLNNCFSKSFTILILVGSLSQTKLAQMTMGNSKAIVMK